MMTLSKACVPDLQRHSKDLLLNNETSLNMKEKGREKLI